MALTLPESPATVTLTTSVPNIPGSVLDSSACMMTPALSAYQMVHGTVECMWQCIGFKE